MDIRNLPPNVNPAELYNAGKANETNNSSAREASGAAEQAPPQVSDDRVDISDAGRAAQAAETSQTEELAFARKAMLGIPPLDDSRMEDIFQRINSGFYSQPEVVKQMAAGVMQTFDAAGGLPTGGEADASSDTGTAGA